MRVLVTGATGFVGSHLVEELNRRGLSLNVLVRRSWRGSLPSWLNTANVTVTYGDVTDSECVNNALNGVDVVIHLASLLGRWQSEFNESEYYRNNVVGTKNLLATSQKEGVDHFIYLSTAGVMGRLINAPADESHPLAPGFPYEKSKLRAELTIRDAMAKDGFPATIIRPTHIYGPRDKNTVKLFKTIDRLGIFPLIGGGSSLFQPLYITDLIDGLLLCMKKSAVSKDKTYLIAGKEMLTYGDFMRISAEILNMTVKTFGISETLVKPLADVSEKIFTSLDREPPLTRSRVEFFSRNQIYNIGKIQREMGFFPKIDIRTGLQLMIDWYRKNATA